MMPLHLTTLSEARSRIWLVAGLALLSFAVTTVSFILQYRGDHQTELARMEQQAESQMAWLQDDIEDDVAMVGDLRSYFSLGGGAPKHDEFRALASRQMALDNGLSGLYWAPRDGQSGGSPEERFPVTFVQPEAEAAEFVGYDLASDPRQREAMEHARDSGTVVSLNAPALPGKAADRRWFIVIAPVYARHSVDVAERRANLTGFLVGLIGIEWLVNLRSPNKTAEMGLDEYFFVGRNASPESLIYAHPSEWRNGTAPPPSFEKTANDPRWTRSISVGDLTLTMTAVAPEGLHPFAPEVEDVTTLFAGIVITAFLVQYLFLNMRRSRELEHRDVILNLISGSVTTLLTSVSFADGMSKALRLVGERLKVDRVLVLENLVSDTPGSLVTLCYGWQAPDIEVRVDRSFFSGPQANTPDIQDWYEPLRRNQHVITTPATARGAVATVLQALKIKSILLVPIHVAGKLWGNIGIDSCKTERVWSQAEIDMLRTLAESMGAAIMRERFVAELSNANKIVNSSPTVLYRLKGIDAHPLIFVAGNTGWFGYSAAELLADPFLYLKIIHPDDAPKVAALMLESLHQQSGSGSIEYRQRKKDGSYCWVESRFHAIIDATNGEREIEGILTDITERKLAEERIVQMARYDGLTGLANRLHFIEIAQQAIARVHRGEKTFAVLYLDLDHFKDVNDTLGHPIGDRLLKSVADRLRASVRETDTVARFGGDEFAVLATNLADAADAGTLATKLRDAIAKPYTIGASVIHIGTSIGIAVFEADSRDMETLLSHADVALYRAKSEGRGQYRFFTATMDEEVRSRFELAADLRDAIARDQLFLVYQPQVEIASGRLLGVEALVRWRHPRFGMLPPPDFITVAEKSGLISLLGAWVIDEACRQTKTWLDAGIAPPFTAVNVSSIQFKAPRELEGVIAASLEKNGLDPQHLEIELTETALMETSLDNNDLLLRLQKRGIKLAIDDFGTGYSSLNYLRRFPVDLIKIAQHFVKDVMTDAGAAAIVKATIGLARELKLDVIAEGVETAEQLALLQSWGCHAAQGFYFARPMTAEEIVPLLRRGAPWRGRQAA